MRSQQFGETRRDIAEKWWMHADAADSDSVAGADAPWKRDVEACWTTPDDSKYEFPMHDDGSSKRRSRSGSGRGTRCVPRGSVDGCRMYTERVYGSVGSPRVDRPEFPGFYQQRGTCWLNACLNAVVVSNASFELLRDRCSSQCRELQSAPDSPRGGKANATAVRLLSRFLCLLVEVQLHPGWALWARNAVLPVPEHLNTLVFRASDGSRVLPGWDPPSARSYKANPEGGIEIVHGYHAVVSMYGAAGVRVVGASVFVSDETVSLTDRDGRLVLVAAGSPVFPGLLAIAAAASGADVFCVARLNVVAEGDGGQKKKKKKKLALPEDLGLYRMDAVVGSIPGHGIARIRNPDGTWRWVDSNACETACAEARDDPYVVTCPTMPHSAVDTSEANSLTLYHRTGAAADGTDSADGTDASSVVQRESVVCDWPSLAAAIRMARRMAHRSDARVCVVGGTRGQDDTLRNALISAGEVPAQWTLETLLPVLPDGSQIHALSLGARESTRSNTVGQRE